MKITSLTVEMVRADTAAAQFLVRVVLDGPLVGGEIKGRVVGPRCPEITTVEIAYPLVAIEATETSAQLKGVIPEPNFWSPEAQFVYDLTVEVWAECGQIDRRTSGIALRG